MTSSRNGRRWFAQTPVIVCVAAIVLVGSVLAVTALTHRSSSIATRSGQVAPRSQSAAAGNSSLVSPRTAKSGSRSAAPTAGPGGGGGTGGAIEPVADVQLGPYGMQSHAIVAENERAGTTDWRISATPSTGYVEGWADTTYAQVGDTVRIYVSSTAPTFQLNAYRMGYYRGAGARDIWSSGPIAGRVQAPCPVISPVTINMVSCSNWTVSLTMAVTTEFVQGDYLLKLTGSGGEQSYIPITIWDPHSTATYLFETHSLTEEAWNDYGGFSFYIGTGPCPPGAPSYPTCNRARVVSFDRPYKNAHGADDFLDNELPLLRFMEEHGLDVAYITDVALDVRPELMLAHKAFLSLGHDETWTYNERKGAEDAVAHGVNMAFMSAAAIVRHARLQPSSIGPNREVVEYRDSNEDPIKNDPKLTTGNTWAVPPTSWPVNSFLGQQYSGYVHPEKPNAPFVVYDSSAWIYKGTGLHDGSVIPNVIGSDIDHLDTATTPANLQVLGHSPIPLSDVLTNQGKWGNYTYSDMTYYTDPRSKAGVFDTGAVTWIKSLTPCEEGPNCPAGPLRQMTGNLLWLFGQGPAGAVVEPKSNWRQVTPAGS